MSENRNQEVTVDDIIARIREEVVKQRETTSPQPGQHSPYASNRLSSWHWSQVSSNLRRANQYADVGTKNLPMMEIPKPFRWLARLTGRIVLYFTMVVTVPQRRFNHHVLQAFHVLLDGVRELHLEVSECTRRIASLESRIDELASAINQKAGQEELQNTMMEETNS